MTLTEERSGDSVAPSLARLVREHRGTYQLPDLRVHPNDEMYRFGLLCGPSPAIAEMAYYRAGMVLADTFRALVDQWCPGGPQRVLDFACGYGRSLRFTIQDFGRDRVWGSEILPEAVGFVGEELGAHAAMSTTQPEELALDGPFDVIFVSSLFSHLPERTFTRWLRELYGRLAPSGLLAFSVHDDSMLTAGQELSPNGIFFGPASEVEAIDTQDYGVTIVSESFVAEAIRNATGHQTYRRLPTALCFQQDLYLVPADSTADLSSLVIRHGAQGDVNECRFQQGRLYLRGWAMTQDSDVWVNRVEVRIDDQLVGCGYPVDHRPDVASFWRAEGNPFCVRSGWETSVELPFEPQAGSILTLTARVTDGSHGVFWSSELGEICSDVRRLAVEPPPSLSTLQQVRATWRAEGIPSVAQGMGRRLSRAAHALRSPAIDGSRP